MKLNDELKNNFLLRTGFFDQKPLSSTTEKLHPIVAEPKPWFKEILGPDTTDIDKKLDISLKYIISKAIDSRVLNPRENTLEHLATELIDYVLTYEGLLVSKDESLVCSLSYAYFNSDVIENGVSPFIHYITTKVSENRENRLLDINFRKVFLKNVLEHNKNISGYEILEFMAKGVKTLKYVNESFDPEFYLKFYKDVYKAKINPTMHYFSQGILEGRLPIDPWKAEKIEYQKEARRKDSLLKSNYTLIPRTAFSSNLVQILSKKRCWFSLSHDDFSKTNGGVQQIMRDERDALQKNGLTYVHLSPVYPYINTLISNNKATYEIRFDDTKLIISSSDLNKLKGVLSSAEGMTIHHMMGFSSNDVNFLINSIKQKTYLYLHDFFGICESVYLQRNGIENCNAPHPLSNACEICNWGENRFAHVQKFKEIAEKVNLITNSEFTKRYYQSKLDLKEINVYPPRHVISISNVNENKNKENIILYIGAQTKHKGWPEFINLSKNNNDFKYVLLCSEDMFSVPKQELKAEGIELIIFDPKSSSVEDEIKKIKPKYVWLVRNCMETFSMVMFDALSYGLIPILNKSSGNVYAFCTENKINHILYPDLHFQDQLTSSKVNSRKVVPIASYHSGLGGGK